MALAATSLVAVLLAAWGWFRPHPRAPQPVLRYELGMAEAERFRPGTDQLRIAISPDGSRLVYVGPAQGGTQLWLRERHQLHASPIPNTVNARNPTFSPDGRQLAFLDGGVRVRVISLDGGPAVTVADSGVLGGGIAWSDDGFIYYDAVPGLSRVPAAGGSVRVVFPLDTVKGEAGQAWPSALPGRKGVLFRSRRLGDGPEGHDIVAGNPETGERWILHRGVFARYVASGHLLIVTAEGNLLAAPFDPGDLKLAGAPVPLLEGIAVKALGSVDLAVSAGGTLLYGSGAAGAGLDPWTPVWVERGGKETAVDSGWTVTLLAGGGLALSPDGTRLALPVPGTAPGRAGTGGADLWIKQLPNGPFTRLTFAIPTAVPFWFPRGDRVGFLWRGAEGARNGWWAQRADGIGNPDSILSGNFNLTDANVSADGRWMVWAMRDARGGSDRAWNIYGMQVGADSAPRRLVAGPTAEVQPRISPDGHWLAYTSNESGRPEVYVRPFPAVDAGRWQVSLEGGWLPRWAPNGRELFFMTPDRTVMAARVVTSPAFTVVDRTIFKPAPGDGISYFGPYDVHPDGRRLIMARRLTGQEGENPGLVVVENFTEELRQKMPH